MKPLHRCSCSALALFCAWLAVAAPGRALEGGEILNKIDAVISAPQDGTSKAVMTLIDKGGSQKERQLRLWTRYFKDKDDWSLTKFLYPPEVRDLGFLSLADDKMYLYLPAFDRVRRIASHARKESFAGSDLSNDDLSTGKYSRHYSATVKEETPSEYVLELTRKPGSDRIYSRVVAWVNKQHFYVTKMEMFDEGESPWKSYEAEIRQIQSYWTPVRIQMIDLRKDHRTLLQMEDIKYDVGLKDDMFSERNLKRKVQE
ncbi:MAG: outer membrane lipoprotein-sorting protein [bacterium]